MIVWPYDCPILSRYMNLMNVWPYDCLTLWSSDLMTVWPYVRLNLWFDLMFVRWNWRTYDLTLCLSGKPYDRPCWWSSCWWLSANRWAYRKEVKCTLQLTIQIYLNIYLVCRFQIHFFSKCPIFKYDFWEEKKTVFKYVLLVRFSHPCPAVVIQISGGLKMDSEVNLQMPTRTLKRPLGMKGWLKGVRGDVKYSGVSICPERLLFRWTSFRPSLFLVVPPHIWASQRLRLVVLMAMTSQIQGRGRCCGSM